jgi:hypothetical protein
MLYQLKSTSNTAILFKQTCWNFLAVCDNCDFGIIQETPGSVTYDDHAEEAWIEISCSDEITTIPHVVVPLFLC